jgi:hypothetical protein
MATAIQLSAEHGARQHDDFELQNQLHPISDRLNVIVLDHPNPR